uniref:Uncharacterized protein n=1 Tax=Meloidogyne floridensis TaxID=298350 RepID=A0A915PCK9_9BILA
METFLKFFCSPTETNYLEAKEQNIKIVDNLIELFKKYNENPEEFYNLDLNEIYSENTKKMVTRKVEKFIETYIEGQLNVFVDRLKISCN